MIILWFKLWFGVWLKLWPKIEESSMISLRDGGLVAAFFGARAGPGLALAPGSRGPGLALAPGSRGPGLALAPGAPRAHQKNAATNPPPRREIIDDSSIFGQSFNHTPNHNLNHNSNHNLNMFPVCSFRPVVCFLLVVIKSITETNGAAPNIACIKTSAWLWQRSSGKF